MNSFKSFSSLSTYYRYHTHNAYSTVSKPIHLNERTTSKKTIPRTLLRNRPRSRTIRALTFRTSRAVLPRLAERHIIRRPCLAAGVRDDTWCLRHSGTRRRSRRRCFSRRLIAIRIRRAVREEADGAVALSDGLTRGPALYSGGG